MDRWVIIPAILAGLCIAFAAVPPVGGVQPSLRLEAWGRPAASRAVLVRASVVESDLGSHAPQQPTWRARGAGGRALRVESLESNGAPFAFARVHFEGPGPWSVEVDAEALHAASQVRERAQSSAVMSPSRSGASAAGIDVAIESGALVPETTTDVLVRVAPPQSHAARIVALSEGLTLEPSGVVPLDACGVAVARATLRGMFATIEVSVVGQDARRIRRSLPVHSGGLTLHVRDSTVQVDSSMAGTRLYWLAGDAISTTRGGVARLESEGDGGRATLTLEPTDQWFAASMSPAFESTSSAWMRPAPDACTASPLGARFERAWAAPPVAPPASTWFDGPANERDRQSRRRRHVRLTSLGVAAAGLLFLSARVARTGLRKPPAGSEPVDLSMQRRLALVVTFVALFVLVGVALFAGFVLRAE